MHIKQVVMTPAQWSLIPCNPIQRDTERHALKAKRKHLGKSHLAHCVVAAANVRGIGLVKLDGHTRAHLWDSGELDCPDAVAVTVFEVDSIADAIDLYKTFDAQEPGEGAADRISGAYRLHGMAPKSEVLIRGGVTAAFRIISGKKVDAYEYVGKFKDELELIDAENFNHEKMVAPVLAAMIIGIRRRGSVAVEYFRRYYDGDGSKTGDTRDAVEALSSMIQLRRAKRQMTGAANQNEIAAIALNGLERYRKGQSVRGAMKALDLREYINEALSG